MVGDTARFDAVLELCGDRYRRLILAVLASESRPLSLDDLTETIVEYNHRASISEIAPDEMDRIRLTLHHQHLPKLEQRGVLAYDFERKLVTPTATFDELQPLFSAVIEIDPSFELPVTP